MPRTRRLALAILALAITAPPARADTITVHGTTAAPWLVDPTFFPRIGASGFNVDTAGSIEFTYSYDSTRQLSTGAFKIVSKDAGGQTIGTLDLSPTQVGALASDGTPTGAHDEYFAGAQWTVGTQRFQAAIDLVDEAGTVLPADPATYLNHLELWGEKDFGIGVADPSCLPGLCEGFLSTITTLSATITPTAPDSDGDGVPDAQDACPGTSSGVVNADGCTIAQLVPCPGPTTGGAWKNHGRYIAEVAKAAEAFLEAGLITEDQKDALVAAAASSTCGK